MSGGTKFSPLGSVSARAEFVQWASSERQERLARQAQELGELASWAEAFDVEEELFFLAWELVQLQPNLPASSQRIALLFVLCSVIHARQGSTCLPLDADGPLLELLNALIPEELRQQPRWRPAQLVAQMLSLLHSDQLDAIIGAPDQFKPMILDGQVLYHQRLMHYERRLVDALSARFFKQEASISLAGLDEAWASVLAQTPIGPRGPVRLTSEQQFAVLSCVHQPLTLITGGPGTGKTSIVVSVLRLALRLGLTPEEVALAAPTGKAANRMQESILGQLASLEQPQAQELMLGEQLPPAQTLHRLLGYLPGASDFLHHEHNPLSAKLVVVDEASMIDMFMMERLVRAVRPHAHLVFLGDADQLPSVEAGAVFRELISAKPHTATPWASLVTPPLDSPLDNPEDPLATFTARLTKSQRMREDNAQGRHILRVAQAIHRGDVGALEDEQAAGIRLKAYPDDALAFSGVEHIIMDKQAPESALVHDRLVRFVNRWFEQRCVPPSGFAWLYERSFESYNGESFDARETQELAVLFGHYQRARLLCLTRVFTTGTESINAMCADQLKSLTGQRASSAFPVGALVMMSRNDYDKELFNGDQGVVLRVKLNGFPERMVVFARGEGFVAFALESLRRDLELAFAITVHKSQGSEFEDVAVVLPAEPIPLLTREILYTALTRGSRSATIWGPRESFLSGVAQRLERHSQVLSALLASLSAQKVQINAPAAQPAGLDELE